MIVLHARVPTRPDKRVEFLAGLPPLVSASREEQGNRSYECYESTETENLFCFVEQWEPMEALQEHARTEHFQSFAGSIPASVSGAPEMVAFETSGPQPIGL